VPYWMWISADAPLLCAAAGAALFGAAVAALLLRGSVKRGIEKMIYRKKEPR